MNSFLPQKLHQLRKNRRLRQEDVARAIHLVRQTYSGYENGVRTPPPETLILLADFYQVPVDYLLREDASEKLAGFCYPLSVTEKDILFKFRSLSDSLKKDAIHYMCFLDLENATHPVTPPSKKGHRRKK